MPASNPGKEKSFKVAKIYGGNEHFWKFSEAASQSFKAGAVLVMSSGLVAEGSADPTSIVGIAAHDAVGTANSDVLVVPALPGVVFRGVLGGSTNPHTLAQSDVGKVYGIFKAASGAWLVDADDSAVANVRVRIVSLVDAVGTSDGEVLFHFLTYTQDTDSGDDAVPVTIWGGYAATT